MLYFNIDEITELGETLEVATQSPTRILSLPYQS